MEDQNINNPPVDDTSSPQDDLTEDKAGTQPDAAGTDASYGQRMQDRLERLGGEPAPVITPDEFARLQKAGQVHIDARGRVQTARRSDDDAGVSLRKRRAWYGK
jgi:hypothetical protein